MNTEKIFVFILCTILSSAIYGTTIPTNIALKSKHLIEVNIEWRSQTEYLSSLDGQYTQFETEADRIHFHFQNVAKLLSSKDVAHLNLSQKTKRVEILNHLNEYNDRKSFPINSTVSKRNPQFIDQNNTHCAVAYLLDKTQDLDIINDIVRHHNDDFIKDMKSKKLITWVDKHGFTIDEIALIQPSYPSTEYVWEVWGNGQGIEGRINVMKTAPDDSFMIVAGSFTSIDGNEAQNIISYDGVEWIRLSALDGIVEDITIDENNQIFAAGELYINDIQVNLVTYQNTQWIPLIKETNGTIHTIQLHNDKLYVGGQFDFIDSIQCSNLAYYDLENNTWSIDSENGNKGVFSTDGIVRDMDITVLDTLVIGGSFSRTGILSNIDTINQDSCYNLSFWNGNDWEHKYAYENIPEVHCLSAEFGLQIGGDMKEDYSLAYRYFVEDWKDFNSVVTPNYTYTENSIIQGFVGSKAYGNIRTNFVAGDASTNLIHCGYLSGSGGLGINDTDGTITAVAKFQNNTYYAGTFTHMEDVQTNGLAKTDGTTSNNTIPSLDLEIYNSFSEITIKGQLSEKSDLRIVNNNGQLVLSKQLNPNQLDEQISLATLQNGVYYVYVQNDTGRYSQKIVVMN